MCGIFGYTGVDPNKTERLLNLIAMRGPDHRACWESNGLTFGHSRLSIIDLSDASNQPFISSDYGIVFNGEIYNYKDIKNTLNFSPKTDSDTEVIIEAYKKWGPACVERLKGMWAFAILDIKKNIIFCSRDRFGMKPFYFSKKTSENFVFGSTIKTVLAHLLGRPEPNIEIVRSYLLKGINQITRKTCFNDVEQLLAGENLIYDIEHDEIHFEKYYDLETGDKLENNKFNDLFEQSIERHLIADVEIGCLLSGGLDSTSIAYKAKERIKKVICLDTSDKNASEIINQRYTIDKLGFNSVFAYFDPKKVDLDFLISIQEEPVSNSSELAKVDLFRKIKQQKLKVVLDGAGGDEILNGYTELVYFNALYNQNFLKRIKTLFQLLVTSTHRKNIIKYILTNLVSHRLLFIFYKLKFSHLIMNFNEFSTNMLLKNDCSPKKDIFIRKLYESIIAINRTTDKTSMSFGIEVRLPFLDNKLVEYCIGAKQENSSDFNKIPLRKILAQDLPLIAENKNKKGLAQLDREICKHIDFNRIKLIIKNNPQFFEQLFTNTFNRKFDSMLRNIDRYSSQLFKLTCLCIWYETFFIS